MAKYLPLQRAFFFLFLAAILDIQKVEGGKVCVYIRSAGHSHPLSGGLLRLTSVCFPYQQAPTATLFKFVNWSASISTLVGRLFAFGFSPSVF